MREKLALLALERIVTTQTVLRLASEAALARALAEERECEAACAKAQSLLEEAFNGWRSALARSAIDASLLRICAEAPLQREAELKQAGATLEAAQRRTNAHRAQHAQLNARLQRAAEIGRRLRKRVDRKLEEKSLVALEQRLHWGAV